MKSATNQRKEHIEKYIQWVTTLSLTIRVCLIRLAVVIPPKSAKSRDILRKLELNIAI